MIRPARGGGAPQQGAHASVHSAPLTPHPFQVRLYRRSALPPLAVPPAVADTRWLNQVEGGDVGRPYNGGDLGSYHVIVSNLYDSLRDLSAKT